MACSPDEQKRLTVTAEAVIGTPARRLAMRATLKPCSPSGIAQPRITSSTSSGNAPGARKRLTNHDRRQVVWAHDAQGALRRLADRSPDGRNDDGILHDYPSQSASRSSTASPTSEVRPSNT